MLRLFNTNVDIVLKPILQAFDLYLGVRIQTMLKPTILTGTLCLFMCILLSGKIHAQPFRFLDGPPNSGDTLKVITYNIHHGADRNEKQTLEAIANFIKASGADLVGLQEVDSLCERSDYRNQMKVLAEITGMHYAFKRHFPYQGGAYGLGILSRYPISDIRGDRITSKSSSDDGRKQTLVLLSALVHIPGGNLVRMATVHLALDHETRLIQAQETLNYLQGEHPVILTGDMNAQPNDAVIDLLETRFTKTDINPHHTFPADSPNRKIDYIMVSKPHVKNVTASTTPFVLYSDHLPLISTIVMHSGRE